MSSGTVYVEVETDWFRSVGEAEAECHDLINDAIDEAIAELEGDDKEVIGSLAYSIEIEKEIDDDGPLYRASTGGEVNWVSAGNDKSKNKAKKRIKNARRTVDIEDTVRAKIGRSGPRYDSLDITDLFLVESDIELSEPVDQLEVGYSEQLFVAINNTPFPQKKSITINLVEKLGTIVLLERTATTKTSSKFGLKYGGASAEHSTTVEFSSKDRRTSDQRTEQTFTDRFDLEVPAFQKWTIKVQKKIHRPVRKMKGKVIVDGKVKLGKKRHRCRGDWPFTKCGDEWSYKSKRIKDLIGEVEFEIEGSVQNDTWDINYSVEYANEDITPDIEKEAITLQDLFPDVELDLLKDFEDSDLIIEIPVTGGLPRHAPDVFLKF